MENTNIPWRWLGGGLLLIIVMVYILGRQSGKKKGDKDSTITAPVPDPEHIDPNLDVPAFSKSLYDSMNGFNFTDRERTDLLRSLYFLNDSEFISVYNQFNQEHGEGSTLRQWIDGEYIGITSDDIKKKLEIRFLSLNLS